MLQNGGQKPWVYFARYKTLQGPKADTFLFTFDSCCKETPPIDWAISHFTCSRGNSANLATARSVKRSCRRLKRNIGWWKTVSSTYSASGFKKTFRISRGTFDVILEKVRHRLQRETKSEDFISPEERFAICLYRLA